MTRKLSIVRASARMPLALLKGRWLLATLLVICTAAVMVGLGYWQFGRLQARRAANTDIATKLALPPLQLAADNDVRLLAHRRVVVSGSWDYAHEVVLRNQTRGGLPGVHVLTPLRIDGSEAAILVDRGWLPEAEALLVRRRAFHHPRRATVEAITQPDQPRRGWLRPAERLKPGETRLDAWFRVDLAAIQRQTPYPLLPVWAVQTTPTAATALPWRSEPIPLAEGPHLSYAIQWWTFATTLVVSYFTFAAQKLAPASAGTSVSRSLPSDGLEHAPLRGERL